MFNHSITRRCQVWSLLLLILICHPGLDTVADESASEAIGEEFQSSENRARLSQLRIRTTGQSIESKCILYEAELRQILGSHGGRDRLTLFAVAIESLTQNKQLFMAHKNLLDELRQCQNIKAGRCSERHSTVDQEPGCVVIDDLKSTEVIDYKHEEAAANNLASLLEQLEAERRRADRLQDEMNARQVVQAEKLLDDPVDKVIELFKNFGDDFYSHCFKYNLVLRHQHPLTPSQIALIGKLNTAGIEVLKYKMDKDFKKKMLDIYEALLAKKTGAHQRIAREIYVCAGFKNCQSHDVVSCHLCNVLDITPGRDKKVSYDLQWFF